MTEILQYTQAFAAVALCLLTAALVWATKVMADETHKSRADANRPRVSAKLKLGGDPGGLIYLVMQNVGRGPAMNLHFQLKGDEEAFNNHNMLWFRGTTSPINFLSPGEIESHILGSAHEMCADPPLQLSIELKYEDSDRKPDAVSINLDVTNFEKMVLSNESNERRQAKALEDIACLLKMSRS